jgi:hypothetical protein
MVQSAAISLASVVSSGGANPAPTQAQQTSYVSVLLSLNISTVLVEILFVVIVSSVSVYTWRQRGKPVGKFAARLDLFKYVGRVPIGGSRIKQPTWTGVMFSSFWAASAMVLAYSLFLSNTPFIATTTVPVTEIPVCNATFTMELTAFASQQMSCMPGDGLVLRNTLRGLVFHLDRSQPEVSSKCVYQAAFDAQVQSAEFRANSMEFNFPWQFQTLVLTIRAPSVTGGGNWLTKHYVVHPTDTKYMLQGLSVLNLGITPAKYENTMTEDVEYAYLFALVQNSTQEQATSASLMSPVQLRVTLQPTDVARLTIKSQKQSPLQLVSLIASSMGALLSVWMIIVKLLRVYLCRIVSAWADKEELRGDKSLELKTINVGATKGWDTDGTCGQSSGHEQLPPTSDQIWKTHQQVVAFIADHEATKLQLKVTQQQLAASIADNEAMKQRLAKFENIVEQLTSE